MDNATVRRRVAEVEQALEALEGLPRGPRETALDAVSALLDLYGEGWARALARLEAAYPGAGGVLADDELVGHLLIVHGLHPEDAESRVRAALEEIEASVNADGVTMELLGLDAHVARLRFSADGHAPAAGLRDLVERAVHEAAPELDRVEVELPAGAGGAHGRPVLVQLQLSRPGKTRAASAGGGA